MTYPIKWNRAFGSDCTCARAINLPQDWQTKKLNAVIENVVCKSRRYAGNTRHGGRLSVAIENFTLVVFFLTQTTPRRPVLSGRALPEQERWPQEMQNRFVTRKSANQSTMVTLVLSSDLSLAAIHPRKWYLHGNMKEKGRKKQRGEGQSADAAARRVNVRMINEERWIARWARRRTRTRTSRGY